MFKVHLSLYNTGLQNEIQVAVPLCYTREPVNYVGVCRMSSGVSQPGEGEQTGARWFIGK